MKMIWPARHVIKIVVSLTFFCTTYTSGQSLDSLREGFKNPPTDAWPRTWWHWTKSNVTREGITKDLEWMKRSGIAGFQLADVNAGGGQTVKDTIVFGTPQWLDAVHFAAAEAERLSLEMAIFSSPGWSLTGGPWVKPEQAMKKLVWSELQVEGARKFSDKLPAPPSQEGPGPNVEGRTDGFYRDIAVIAFRTPDGEDNKTTPQVTTDQNPEKGNVLWDNDLTTSLSVRSWIQLNYEQPFFCKINHHCRPQRHSVRQRIGKQRWNTFHHPGSSSRKVRVQRRQYQNLCFP